MLDASPPPHMLAAVAATANSQSQQQQQQQHQEPIMLAAATIFNSATLQQHYQFAVQHQLQQQFQAQPVHHSQQQEPTPVLNNGQYQFVLQQPHQQQQMMMMQQPSLISPEDCGVDKVKIHDNIFSVDLPDYYKNDSHKFNLPRRRDAGLAMAAAKTGTHTAALLLDDVAPEGMGNGLSSPFYEENPQAFLEDFGPNFFEDNWQDPHVQPPLALAAAPLALAGTALGPDLERETRKPEKCAYDIEIRGGGIQQKKWEDRRQELIKYRDTVGDTNVPQHYEENKQLGRWVATQRHMYSLLKQQLKPSTMTPKRIQSLNEIGFLWEASVPKKRILDKTKQASTISVPRKRKKLETSSSNIIGGVDIWANFISPKGTNNGKDHDAFTSKPGNFFSMKIEKNVSVGVHLALGDRNPPQEIKDQLPLLDEFLQQRDATSSRGANTAATRNLLNVMSGIYGTKEFPSTGDPKLAIIAGTPEEMIIELIKLWKKYGTPAVQDKFNEAIIHGLQFEKKDFVMVIFPSQDNDFAKLILTMDHANCTRAREKTGKAARILIAAFLECVS